jgi:hypothetical protein
MYDEGTAIGHEYDEITGFGTSAPLQQHSGILG